MRTKLSASIENMLLDQYGRERRPALSNAAKLDALLANHYGKAQAPAFEQHRHRHPHHHHLHAHLKKRAAPAAALSLGHDDGERLPQRGAGNRFGEFASAYSIADVPFEEYVVSPGAQMQSLSRTRSLESAGEAPAADEQAVQEEYVINILQPLKGATPPAGRSQVVAPAAPARVAPAQHAQPAAALPRRDEVAAALPQRGEVAATLPRRDEVAAEAAPAATPVSEASSADDDFIKDMQAILSGQKAFDVRSKSTVPVDKLGQMMSAPPAAAAPLGPNTGDDIFAKLAQSMTYANAYDIGTVELENRFADFDKMDELRKQAAADKKRRSAEPVAPANTPGSAPGTAEFIQDLDAIRRSSTEAAAAPQAAAPTGATAAPPTAAAGVSLSQSAGGLSQPLYDTGEHVLTGGNFYVDQLRVGANPGVKFSYGQIIAMADLFESVDQMNGTSVNELSRIKALIERSTAYYAGNKADPSKDVSDDEWDSVTGGSSTSKGRYLTLAEMNFEHFSPNFLYRNATFAAAANRHGNNKTAWESYHERAIKEAQAIGASSGPANSSPLLPLEGPLITNAFGDHFLTDAFSAGHLVNKDAIIEFWKTMFFQGADLLPAAKAFFDKLAAAAFARGKVHDKFSVLETVEFKGVIFRPNIDRPSRFSALLQEIATQQPDRIGNLILKAIHDRLNADGVDVFNTAGDGSWRLTGDGTLNSKNRQIIQKAVAQSIANINDPSIIVSNIDVPAYLAKVWKHVPQLTPASERSVQRVVRQYVDPDSALLVDAAAVIIEKKADLLIRELIAAHALKRA